MSNNLYFVTYYAVQTMKLIYFMCFHNYREKPSISVIPTFFSFRIIKSFLIQFQDEHESNGPGGRARNSEGQPQETELELDAERQSKHRNRKQTRLAETATSSSEIIIKRAKNYFDNILLSFFWQFDIEVDLNRNLYYDKASNLW